MRKLKHSKTKIAVQKSALQFKEVFSKANAVSKALRIEIAKNQPRTFQGIEIVIDRPKGFVQQGEDPSGEKWERTYLFDYGFIASTKGGDAEELDVFLGNSLLNQEAHWIIQLKEDGSFDEYKLMLGFESQKEAVDAYLAHVPKKYFGSVATMTVGMVKALLGLDPKEEVQKLFVGYLKQSLGVLKNGIELSSDLKAERPNHAIRNAWEIAGKIRHKLMGAEGDSFEEHAKNWVKSRGLLDANSAYGSELGKAVLQLARVFEKQQHSGMSAVLARAYFSFLCDAWDVMHTLILNNEDFERVQGLIANSASEFAKDFENKTTTPTEDRSSVAEKEMRWKTVEVTASEEGALKIIELLKAIDNLGAPGHSFGIVSDDEEPVALGSWDGDGSDHILVKSISSKNQVEKTTEDRSSVDEKQETVERSVKLASPVEKSDVSGELHYVLGIVLEPDVVDSQSDTYTAEEIRKTAWLYMENFRNVGLMHKGLVNHCVKLVESFIAPIDMEIGGSVIKAGTWLMGLHVLDEEMWGEIKQGGLTGLSIGGFATRTPIN